MTIDPSSRFDLPALVGELNPYGSAPEYALYDEPEHSAGGRLRMILGLRRTEYINLPRYNLCVGSWNRGYAENTAREIAAQHGVIIALGRKVSDSFPVKGVKYDFFTKREIKMNFVPRTIVFLPHPSGMNRMWNDPFSRIKTLRLLKEICPAVPWGNH